MRSLALVRHSALVPFPFTALLEQAGGTKTPGWTPSVDVLETPDAFVVRADLPGVDPSTIEVHLDHTGALSLQGERPPVEDGSEAVRQERAHGTFLRRFQVPDTVDADRIEASGQHGVLTVRIPKKAPTAPRRIEVTA